MHLVNYSIHTLNDTMNRVENILLAMKKQEFEYWETWKKKKEAEEHATVMDDWAGKDRGQK